MPSSVKDFHWRLDTIENDLCRLPPNLCVLLTDTPLTGDGARYSLFGCKDRHRLGTHTASWFSEGKLPFYPSIGQSTDRFPFGVVLSRTPALIQLETDADRTWLKFGGKCGFCVSGDTVRDSLPEGQGAEWTDGIIWHYFAKNTGDPIPKESSFDSVYEQLLRCYRGILEVCMDFEDQLSLGGDELTTLTTVIYELEWPEVLLYLGWKQSHPLLRVEHDSVVRSFQGEELIPFGAAEDWHNVFRICPSSVVRATSYALETLRRMFHAVDASAAGGRAAFRSKKVTFQGGNMSNNSSRIAVSNILTPLVHDVEEALHLTEAAESFDQRNKETIERDRDELRRSGILTADWTPNETNANHRYWDEWSERLRKVADELKAAGETAIAGQLLTFFSQIDGRDEVTCESDFRFEKLAEWLTEHLQAGGPPQGAETPKKSKRSTVRDEGRDKLIAALTKHHKYADGSCLNQEHIGNNELARQAGVSTSTASTFFKKEFDRHEKYRAICGDVSKLIAALKLLNNEFSPHFLYGDMPPGERDRDDEE